MSRAHVYKVLLNADSTVLLGASVRVLQEGADAVITDPLYTSNSGSGTLDNPFVSNSGVVEFYLDAPQRVRLGITPPGAAEVVITVDADPRALEIVRAEVPLSLGTPTNNRFLRINNSGQIEYITPAAAQVAVDPTGLAIVTGTDVQAAINELDAGVATIPSDAPFGGAATAVTVDPSGLIVVTSSDVQAALEELDAAVAAAGGGGGGGGASAIQRVEFAAQTVTSGVNTQQTMHFGTVANAAVLEITDQTTMIPSILWDPAGRIFTIEDAGIYDLTAIFEAYCDGAPDTPTGVVCDLRVSSPPSSLYPAESKPFLHDTVDSIWRCEGVAKTVIRVPVGQPVNVWVNILVLGTGTNLGAYSLYSSLIFTRLGDAA